jgi:hypothetical protein
MKKFMMAALGVGAALTLASTAQAAQGCGPGGHRGPYGGCRPNFGPGPALGVFYPGRGYWDGHRYYMHRGHYGAGWRYW